MPAFLKLLGCLGIGRIVTEVMVTGPYLAFQDMGEGGGRGT